MDKKLLLIIFGLVLISALTTLGILYFYKSPAKKQSAETQATAPSAVEVTKETNKTVTGETTMSGGDVYKSFSGTVKSVSDKAIVLTQENNEVSIFVSAETKIARNKLTEDKENPIESTDITLNDIRSGDRADAVVRVVEGQAWATLINVMSTQ